MPIRIMVVAENQQLRERYRQQVIDLGEECEAVPSIRDLYQVLHQRPCNGLLIDLHSSVKASPSEKVLLHELQELYPVLRMRWNEQTGQLRCLLYGSTAGSGMSVSHFLEHHCRPVSPLKLPREKRQDIRLNVLISRSEMVSDEETRSTTLDVTSKGCSLYTTESWSPGEKVWLTFTELRDPNPIPAEVKRHIPWGTPAVFPSIGLSFLVVSASQEEQLGNAKEIFPGPASPNKEPS